MPPKKIQMRDSVLAAIGRVSSEKCTEDFSLSDLKSQYATIISETGSKAKKPATAINVQLQALVSAGALKKGGQGKFTIVPGVIANVRKASAKKASKKASAKKATGRKASAKKTTGRKASAKKASAKKTTTVKKAAGPKKSGVKRKRSATKSVAPRRKKAIHFSSYSYKVLQSYNIPGQPSVGISRKGMLIVDGMVLDTLHRLGQTSLGLAQRVGRKTVTQSDVEAATKMLLPGELAKHAVSEAVKALDKYKKNKTGPSTKRAGLLFSVPRTARLLRAMMPHTNISATAPVYAAAVMEYILAEVFELSRNATLDHKRRRITPRALSLTVLNDEELNHFFKASTIAGGGVLSHINPKLLPPAKKARVQ